MLDDKIQVIWAVTILGLVAMAMLGNASATTIVGNIISGLFGIAVGKTLK